MSFGKMTTLYKICAIVSNMFVLIIVSDKSLGSEFLVENHFLIHIKRDTLSVAPKELRLK